MNKVMLAAAPLLLCPMLAAAAQSAPDQQACVALANRSTAQIQVQTAEWVAAGAGMPEHCLVRLMIGARPSGLPDMSYGTGVELRLPRDWNGRLLFQGGGGLDGTLLPATGRVAGFPSALERGFAVVSTDSGHRGRNSIDARFGADQQAKLDFAYQAVERRHARGQVRAGRLLRSQAGSLLFHGLLHRRARSDAGRAASAAGVRRRGRGQCLVESHARGHQPDLEPADRHAHRAARCDAASPTCRAPSAMRS